MHAIADDADLVWGTMQQSVGGDTVRLYALKIRFFDSTPKTASLHIQSEE